MYTNQSLRQIITHAAVARGQKYFTQTFTLRPGYRPGNILGSRLTGHDYTAEPTDGGVRVNGSFVLHVWYDYERGTQTDNIDQAVEYHLTVPTDCLDGERLGRNEFAEACVVQRPHIVQVSIRGDRIDVTVEVEFKAEVFGDCKLWVRTYDPDDIEGKDEEDETWGDDDELSLADEDSTEDDFVFRPGDIRFDTEEAGEEES